MYQTRCHLRAALYVYESSLDLQRREELDLYSSFDIYFPDKEVTPGEVASATQGVTAPFSSYVFIVLCKL